MSDGSSVDEWLKFFEDAALPKEFAETYAVTFSKNQMKLDMLPDITKEHLLDMGISLVGHIISILRHAKTVHNQTVTRTTLSKCPAGSAEKKVDPVSSLPTKPISTPKKYSLKSTTPTINGIKDPVISSDSGVRKITKIRLSPGKPVLPSVDVKKIRKVTPEQEGAYKIKMPSGTTTRSREILARQKIVAGDVEKKPVFERLGLDTSVSSSTEESREIEVQDWKNSSTSTSKSEGEGVFSRLGHRCQVSSTAEDSGGGSGSSISPSNPRRRDVVNHRTVVDNENNDVGSSAKQLPYIGIFKSSSSGSSVKQPISTTTVRERTLHSDKLVSGSSKPSLINRLHLENEPKSLKNVVFKITNKMVTQKVNVKDRLGVVNSDEAVVNKVTIPSNKPTFEPYPLRSDRRLQESRDRKKVSFGSVSRQKIPGRLDYKLSGTQQVNDDEDDYSETSVLKYKGSIGMGTGVFSRLGH